MLLSLTRKEGHDESKVAERSIKPEEFEIRDKEAGRGELSDGLGIS